MTSPILYRWDGDAMVPLPHFRARCDDEFVVEELYPLVPDQGRSQRSHNHYFACIKTAWLNLPEMEAANYPSPEHLRKFALIQNRYADERSIVCSSKAEAQRMAAFIKPMDEYAVVLCRECVVKVFTAQTQSKKAMGATLFQESKTAVLDWLEDFLGLERDGLRQNSEAA
ncbi:MAG: hypothetical protein JJ902_03840 [Roseibium sp.]|nr:hypothetical protein [Roseibium sp.]